MTAQGLSVARITFWICAFLVVYPYVVYPILLFFAYSLTQVWRDLVYLTGRRGRRTLSPAPDELPAVSIIVPAHNEEQILPQKIENLRRLDYSLVRWLNRQYGANFTGNRR